MQEYPSVICVCIECNCDFSSALEMQIKKGCQLMFFCQTFHQPGRLHTVYNLCPLPGLLQLGARSWRIFYLLSGGCSSDACLSAPEGRGFPCIYWFEYSKYVLPPLKNSLDYEMKLLLQSSRGEGITLHSRFFIIESF